MKVILCFSALFVLCAAQYDKKVNIALDIEFITEDNNIISKNLSSVVDDITNYFENNDLRTPDSIYFQLGLPTRSKEINNRIKYKINTNNLFRMVKSNNAFKITNDEEVITFRYKKNSVLLTKSGEDEEGITRTFAMQDYDYFDRTKIAYLKKLSGKWYDGNRYINVKYREFDASVTTKGGEVITKDLVKASMRTREYYEHLKKELPQYLYIKVEHLSGISIGHSYTFQLNWVGENIDNGNPNLQSCKYLGKVVGETNERVRLEVCRFLAIYLESENEILLDSNYLTRESENLPTMAPTLGEFYDKIHGNTAHFDEGLDVTFVLDRNLARSLGRMKKKVVASIVKQANYYFHLPRFSYERKINIYVNGILKLGKASKKLRKMDDGKALRVFKRYTMRNKKLNNKMDTKTTDIIVLLRKKNATGNSFARSFFGGIGRKEESMAVVSYENIEEAARLLAREVAHIMGIDNIQERYNEEKYFENNKVQYIMNDDDYYKKFDVSKQVDWSTSTQEQSDNSIELCMNSFADESPKRMRFETFLNETLSFAEQCQSISYFNVTTPQNQYSVKKSDSRMKCKVLTCEFRGTENVPAKNIIPLEGTPCGYNSVCTNGYCRNEVSSDLLIDGGWSEEEQSCNKPAPQNGGRKCYA